MLAICAQRHETGLLQNYDYFTIKCTKIEGENVERAPVCVHARQYEKPKRTKNKIRNVQVA